MRTPAISQLYRTAFVTGASTGLGRAFAEMLLAEGVRVWGTSRDTTRLRDLVSRCGGNFVPVALDLVDAAGAEQVFLRADAHARFDLVVNNAGYGAFGEFAAADFAVWQQQIEVMLVHTARLSHVAMRRMGERQRGALVNVSSLAAEFPLPFQSAYNVAKAGLTALNESLMVEAQGTGVAVIDFRPGDYRTHFESSVRQVSPLSPRAQRAWAAFAAMMRSGPAPEHAAKNLRRALMRQRSVTVRTGRFFQASVAPFLARFGSLGLKRRIQARYFDVS